jgi:glycosyltransferase involved in cell wall biosynthesis
VMHWWRELFKEYDLVQAYSTDPILPMLTDMRPYVAFEHGTLREFTLGDTPVCRATSLAYRLADHVFITNGDCREYAERIGVARYSPMLHPFDERRIRSAASNYADLHQRLGAKFVFLCTLRHDWVTKGTDKYIRALPEIAHNLDADFVLLMTEWGQQVEDSKRLARELDVLKFIQWIQPMRRPQLFRILKSVDVLFDQIALPHFGSTGPEGIAAGVPVIASYDPSSTDWLVDRPAPILAAWTVADIVEGVRNATDPTWLAKYRSEARDWINDCHNSARVVNGHLDVYRRLLERSAVAPGADLQPVHAMLQGQVHNDSVQFEELTSGAARRS